MLGASVGTTGLDQLSSICVTCQGMSTSTSTWGNQKTKKESGHMQRFLSPLLGIGMTSLLPHYFGKRKCQVRMRFKGQESKLYHIIGRAARLRCRGHEHREGSSIGVFIISYAVHLLTRIFTSPPSANTLSPSKPPGSHCTTSSHSTFIEIS